MQDGSIFLNIVKLKRLLGEKFKLEIDVNDDVFEMGAVQHHCFGRLKKPMAVWILGGGGRLSPQSLRSKGARRHRAVRLEGQQGSGCSSGAIRPNASASRSDPCCA